MSERQRAGESKVAWRLKAPCIYNLRSCITKTYFLPVGHLDQHIYCCNELCHFAWLRISTASKSCLKLLPLRRVSKILCSNLSSKRVFVNNHNYLYIYSKHLAATTMEGAGNGEHRKGLWTVEEDVILMDYVKVHGKGKWNRAAKFTG